MTSRKLPSPMIREKLFTSMAGAAMLLTAVAATAAPRCELDGQPVNPYDAATTAGLTGLMRCIEEGTGLVSSEQELRGGVFMGLSRFFDAKGKPQRERMINERGNTEGFERTFWPNGVLRSESRQNNGRMRGASRTYFESGKPERASFTLDGGALAALSFDRDGLLTSLECSQASVLAEDVKPCGFDGKVQTALFLNGQRRELRTMERGKILAATTYVESPVAASSPSAELIKSELTFQNGQRWHRSYSTDRAVSPENVLRQERLYEPGRSAQGNELSVNSTSGRLQWSKAWGANGQLIEHVRYTNGQPSLTERWHPNGAIKEKMVLAVDGGGKRSVRESFDDEARLMERQTTLTFGTRRDQLTGLQQTFHTNGKLAVEQIYSKPDAYGRTRLISRKQWDQNGKLQSTDGILDDGSRKQQQ